MITAQRSYNIETEARPRRSTRIEALKCRADQADQAALLLPRLHLSRDITDIINYISEICVCLCEMKHEAWSIPEISPDS